MSAWEGIKKGIKEWWSSPPISEMELELARSEGRLEITIKHTANEMDRLKEENERLKRELEIARGGQSKTVRRSKPGKSGAKKASKGAAGSSSRRRKSSS